MSVCKCCAVCVGEKEKGNFHCVRVCVCFWCVYVAGERRRLSSFPSVQLCLFLSALPKPIKFALSCPPTPTHPKSSSHKHTHTHLRSSPPLHISVYCCTSKAEYWETVLLKKGRRGDPPLPPRLSSIPGPPDRLFCCVTFSFLPSLLSSFFLPILFI